MRVVLDTNVLLAAFGTRGLCESLVLACLDAHRILLCQHIIDELRRHFMDKFKMPAAQVDAIVQFLGEHGELVEPVALKDEVFSDPGDLPVLGAAVAGQADYLVTGDHALASLVQFRHIPIVSPRMFYDAHCKRS